MKINKITSLIVALIFSTTFFGQSWDWVWEETFSGSTLNDSVWTHEIGSGSQYGLWGWGNGEQQFYQASNSEVSNGQLKITAKQEPNGLIDSWGNSYYLSSSKIISRDKMEFRYGKVEARVKTINGEGFWPAFWMLPSGGSWPCDGEIDIMEQWGNPYLTNSTSGAAHIGTCPYSSSTHFYETSSSYISSGSYADDFHTYSVIWKEDTITWYVDEIELFSLNPSSYWSIPSQSAWPFNSNEWYLMINLAITQSGPDTNTIFPNQIEIDYVRVYENIGSIFGCTDISAQNYNSNADIDNGSCEYLVNFQVNTNCADFSNSPSSINITGPSINWSCQSSYSLSDLDGDGIWNGSFVLPLGDFEYIYCADNWSQSEDLLNYGSSTGDWSCTPITDYWSYANRVINITSDTSITNVWESCSSCIGGCTSATAINYNSNVNYDDGSCNYSTNFNVTFQVDMNNVTDYFVIPELNGTFNSWCGNCSSMSDSDGNNIWDITVSLQAGYHEYKFSSDNWTIQEALLNAGNCVLSTGQFTNRVLNISSDTILDVVCWESCTACLVITIYGCTDPAATNYDANATIDDGNCQYGPSLCAGANITGLTVSDVIHDRATFNFDNMNTYDGSGNQICRVDQIRIKYREVGTSGWSQKNMAQPTGYDAVTGICNSTQNTSKITRNLTASTTYEWEVKVWYCDGQNTGFISGPNFTTSDDCPNVGNLNAYGATPTKATFTWDNSNGVYEFVRLKARVDSISNPTGADFFQIGGAGVSYGTYTKNKQNVVPGETYRGQARTYCDPNGGAYRSPTWTSLVYWTQPTVRIEGNKSITNLDVYPNPSDNEFNISFTSEKTQDLKLRVVNVMGEEIIKEQVLQFVGEYTIKLFLENNAKGIYFLEIETTYGFFSKKIILK